MHSEAEISLAQRTGAHLLLPSGLFPSFLAQVPSWGCENHVLPERGLQNLPAAPPWLHRQLSTPPCLPGAACSFLVIAAHCGAHLHAQASVLHMLLLSQSCQTHVLPERALEELPTAPARLHRQLSAPPPRCIAACSFLLVAHCTAHLHAHSGSN